MYEVSVRQRQANERNGEAELMRENRNCRQERSEVEQETTSDAVRLRERRKEVDREEHATLFRTSVAA